MIIIIIILLQNTSRKICEEFTQKENLWRIYTDGTKSFVKKKKIWQFEFKSIKRRWMVLEDIIGNDGGIYG